MAAAKADWRAFWMFRAAAEARESLVYTVMVSTLVRVMMTGVAAAARAVTVALGAGDVPLTVELPAERVEFPARVELESAEPVATGSLALAVTVLRIVLVSTSVGVREGGKVSTRVVR